MQILQLPLGLCVPFSVITSTGFPVSSLICIPPKATAVFDDHPVEAILFSNSEGDFENIALPRNSGYLPSPWVTVSGQEYVQKLDNNTATAKSLLAARLPWHQGRIGASDLHRFTRGCVFWEFQQSLNSECHSKKMFTKKEAKRKKVICMSGLNFQ